MVRRVSPEILAFVLLSLASAGLAAFYAGRLPARVATHFGPSGAPDAWGTRGELLAFTCLFPIATALFILGVAALVARIPDEWQNLPHRDYWLAPERRAATHARIRRGILRIGAATMVLLLVVQESVLRANADGSGRLGAAMPLALGLYLAAVGWLLWGMVGGFRRPTG